LQGISFGGRKRGGGSEKLMDVLLDWLVDDLSRALNIRGTWRVFGVNQIH
jgi:hypothetical protein